MSEYRYDQGDDGFMIYDRENEMTGQQIADRLNALTTALAERDAEIERLKARVAEIEAKAHVSKPSTLGDVPQDTKDSADRAALLRYLRGRRAL